MELPFGRGRDARVFFQDGCRDGTDFIGGNREHTPSAAIEISNQFSQN
ncbi:hypothetical protein DA2_0747 [Desulfovibrio sp. A2]|nr:hypothetical protein DA2_0747 [Desulfovibrio sp. A2]